MGFELVSMKTMSRGKLAIGGALLAILAAGAVLLVRPGTGARKPPRPLPPPRANFVALEVRAVDAHDRPEAAVRAQEESGKVIDLLNTYYNAAFLDSRKWGKGTHPALTALFTAEAAPQAAQNLGALALSDLALRVRRVAPSKQEATKISIQIEDDLSAPIAVVAAVFEGSASTRSKADGPVKISHHALFWLVREGDAYRIMAYTTELTADTKTKSAAFGVPRGVEAA